MIRINILTYNKIKVKSFNTLDKLVDYCLSEFSFLVGTDYSGAVNSAQELAIKIWNTNVGQTLKTDLGHTIAIASKGRSIKQFVI